jgi:hypothetical protein
LQPHLHYLLTHCDLVQLDLRAECGKHHQCRLKCGRALSVFLLLRKWIILNDMKKVITIAAYRQTAVFTVRAGYARLPSYHHSTK